MKQGSGPAPDGSDPQPAETQALGPDDLEPRIRQIGERLFAAVTAEGLRSGASFLSGKALQRRILGRAFQDPRLKTQLFRFVDVYPSLRGSGDVVRHLRAYLAGCEGLPRPLDRLLATSADKRLPTWAAARLTERGMARMAKSLIPGRDTAEALPTLKRLRRSGAGFSLDILGETCLSEAEAAEYLRRYLDVLDILPPRAARWPVDQRIDRAPWGDQPRVNLSLKLTSLYSQLDPLDFEASRQALVAALRPLLLKAREHGVFVNLDMERFVYRDLTYAVFADLALDQDLDDYPHMGVVLQAYLRDAGQQLDDLIALAHRRGTPFTVRLVKGAYWDHETIIAAQEHWPSPVFHQKSQTDAQFERLAGVLIDNWEWTRPALGTHNLRSIAAAMAKADAAGLPPGALEFQFLHGMADSIRRVTAAEGARVREYVPVGEPIPGMAYLVRRLLENTANESFLRLVFMQDENPDALLAPPIDRTPAGAAAPAPTIGPAPFQNEPKADFSRAEARATMDKALATIRSSLGRDYPLLIGPHQVNTGSTIVSTNPARPEEVVGTVASAGAAEADRALETAVAAFPLWRDIPAPERVDTLLRAASLMRDRRFELAALEVVEAGKPWREADADVTEAIDFLEYYSREMLRLTSPRNLSDVPGEEDLYFYEPRGVAAVIAPWNFPMAIPTGMASAALAAGNTVVFKPASATPVLGYALVRIMREAGVPDGAISFLPGPGGELGEYLAGDPRVDMIAFTGSLEVGLSIMEKAALFKPGQKNIKKVIAELGGKNAIIIDSDADLDAALDGVIISAFYYAGQKCSACSRVIVIKGVYEQFVRRLTQAIADLKVGDPAEPGTRVGPIITAEAQKRMLATIEHGRAEATMAYPPEEWASPGDEAAITGHFVPPHLFVDVPRESSLAHEEIFGPVLVVMKAEDFGEAIELALDVRYALTGGVYSRNPVHIDRAYREFRVGNLYINRPITGAMVGRQPFGGTRMSGVGSKAGGPDYLLQFMEPRTVTENTIRRGFAPTDSPADTSGGC